MHIKNKEYHLESETTLQEFDHNIVLPSFNILENDFQKTMKTISPFKPIKMVDLDVNSIDLTQHKLNELKTNLQSRINEPFVIKYENAIIKTIGYITIALVFGTTVFYAYKIGIFKILSKPYRLLQEK